MPDDRTRLCPSEPTLLRDLVLVGIAVDVAERHGHHRSEMRQGRCVSSSPLMVLET